MLRRLLPALALVATLLAIAPSARAAAGMEVGIQDDDVLLLRNQVANAFQGFWGDAPSTYKAGKTFRASFVRIMLGWSSTLPASQVKLKKAPKTKQYTWAVYDRAIAQAKAHGYKVELV